MVEGMGKFPSGHDWLRTAGFEREWKQDATEGCHQERMSYVMFESLLVVPTCCPSQSSSGLSLSSPAHPSFLVLTSDLKPSFPTPSLPHPSTLHLPP